MRGNFLSSMCMLHVILEVFSFIKSNYSGFSIIRPYTPTQSSHLSLHARVDSIYGNFVYRNITPDPVVRKGCLRHYFDLNKWIDNLNDEIHVYYFMTCHGMLACTLFQLNMTTKPFSLLVKTPNVPLSLTNRCYTLRYTVLVSQGYQPQVIDTHTQENGKGVD